ncbi:MULTISPECIES: hypothetical protein [unclassified Meiothermus]|uniref:hypothetical protein n=1 Tax=unclassified Meiothermus TaxID=370471 RepID=UPI000D7BF649|nr:MULTISPECIES: hypothetical protein [unclassified Meiothermus]PZA08725.1 hypothetical protein DNA98_01375 [Meiothermus sp. Pnk-1]RYM40655.1 hypothetical protein EWH23_00570 [Meiothermus sp. PNK-Is4]
MKTQPQFRPWRILEHYLGDVAPLLAGAEVAHFVKDGGFFDVLPLGKQDPAEIEGILREALPTLRRNGTYSLRLMRGKDHSFEEVFSLRGPTLILGGQRIPLVDESLFKRARESLDFPPEFAHYVVKHDAWGLPEVGVFGHAWDLRDFLGSMSNSLCWGLKITRNDQVLFDENLG